MCSFSFTVKGEDAKPVYWIGDTEGRNDLPDGSFANWVTNRACVVKADGIVHFDALEGQRLYLLNLHSTLYVPL